MYLLPTWIIFPILIAFSISSASAKMAERTSYFVFGSSYEEAEILAYSHGWKIQKASFHPNAWSVTGTKLTLYFCDQKLGSIDEYLPGGFREFVDTVWALRLEHGEPSTKISHIPPLGRVISSTFKTERGLRINVQIEDRKNAVTLWTKTTDTFFCRSE